jgi:hypothetical protein
MPTKRRYEELKANLRVGKGWMDAVMHAIKYTQNKVKETISNQAEGIQKEFNAKFKGA